MAKSKIILSIFFFWLGGAALGWEAEAQEPSKEALTLEDYAKLRRGDVIIKANYRPEEVPPEYGGPLAVLAYIQAPTDLVWETLANWENYAKIIPHVQEVKLIEKAENKMLLYFNLYLALHKVRYYLNYFFYKEKNLVTFELEQNKNNDFKKFHGYFKFDPVSEQDKDRVLVVYSVDTELSRYFPHFIKEYFARKDMPKVIANLKKWVETKAKAGSPSAP